MIKIKIDCYVLEKWQYTFFLIFQLIFLKRGSCFDITFDNRLSVVPSDCYTRVSIGSRLSDSAVISTSPATSISDCEATCSANGTSCNSFSFGVGVKGNISCSFSREIPRQNQNLQVDADYDVYIKGRVSLRGCRAIRLSPSQIDENQTTDFDPNQFQISNSNNNALSINSNNNNNSKRIFGNSSLFNIFGNSILSRGRNKTQITPKEPLKNVILSPDPANDDRIRISDILINKDNYHEGRIKNDDYLVDGLNQFDNWGALEHGHAHKLEHYPSSIIYNHDVDGGNYDYNNYWLSLFDAGDKSVTEDKFGKRIIPLGTTTTIEYPILKNLNNDQTIFYHQDDNDWAKLEFYPGFGKKINSPLDFSVASPWLEVGAGKWPSLSDHQSSVLGASELPNDNEKAKMWRLVLSLILVTKSVSLGTVIIVQDANCDDPCFRRLLTGKRLVDGYVRKTIECNKLHDCHRMCEYERGFTCEGFNYRSHPKGVCELTSMPPGRMDTGRDFIPDSQFDFYERDWTRPKCSYQSSSSTGRQKSRRPNSWWPVDGSDSIPWQGQYPSERPRGNPQGFSGQWDKSGQRRPGISSYNNRDDYWQIPLPVRPIEQEYPQRPPLASSRRPDRFNQPAERFPAGHGYERTPQYFTPVRPGPDNQIIYNGNGYSYGHRSATRQHKFPQRRIGYNSNPDTNEVTHHYPQERPLKPSYCNSCRPYSERELHGKPLSLNDHEDEYKNYGGAYDHSDHPRLPAQPPKVLPLLPEHRECAVRSISGYRLARGMIRKSYLTENLEQCESLCQHQREFTCLTFAYRYNLAPTAPADNCLMSDAVFENLIYYTDLDPDRDYDIYAMTDKSSKLCEHQRQQASSLRHPADECFWRIKSGFSMPATIVRKPMRVDGMGECQVQCVNSRDFTCRSFVFKYETFSSDGVSNCFLSDWSAGEIDQRKMQDMDGAELYERGSFGRGCEPHLPVLPLQVDQSILKTPHLDEASCYTGYDRPCKLTPWAIILTSTVNSEADCRRKCSSMRQNHLTPCMSFSYKQDDRRGDNCLLSDIPTRDLRPGFDYIHDDENYVLYAWKELEPRCSSSGQSSQFNQRHDPPPSSGYIPPKLSTESKPYTKPDDPYFQQVALSDPNRPANIENSAFNSVADYNQKFFFNIPDEMSVFHHYTVSGRRCKRGTKCERNKIVGFWACEPEGADFGSWDYCCEPSHQCGFSQGFSYPWCYVGSSPEQWRPCSETYEPNYEKPRPLRPSRPRVEDDSNNDQKEHDSRHWPIAFLHHEAPPNGTDSIALANHVKDQTTNETIVSNSGGDDPGVVVPIEINNNSTNTTTHLERRGETSENEDEILTIVPLEIAENRTEESSERLSSSLKIQPVDNSSSSYKNISGRFSRENNGQQYLFTKRLNAGLSTMQKKIPDFSEAGGNGGRGFVAKIERVNKSNDVIVNNDNLSTRGQRLVTLSSSKGTSTSNSTIIPPVLQNTLTVIPTNISTERHWQKIEVVEKSHD